MESQAGEGISLSPPPSSKNTTGAEPPNPSPATLDKEAILRQVEYYFSDENLVNDAHLLGKLEEGNGTVSLLQILSFPRMHKYKPRSAVREVLKESNVIELVDNNTRIKRRQPYDVAKAKVTPRINYRDAEGARRKVILEANPHLTKGMLKPTGFEHDYVEPELSAEDKQAALEEYSTEIPFCDRIETAILKYKMNRKLHQETGNILSAFLEYGGFDQRTLMFAGGATKEELEGLTKEEKARRKQNVFVSEAVRESLEAEDGKWTVDFDGVLRGFFSTYFPEKFLFNESTSRQRDRDVTNGACNIFRNFFNYLLHHGVCTEYTDQILAARASLNVIEDEFPKLADFQQVFPGDFSIACSTLLKGYHYLIQYRGDWMSPEEVAGQKPGFSPEEATWISNAGVAAFAEHDNLEAGAPKPKLAIVDTEEHVGLEIAVVIPPEEIAPEAQDLFTQLAGTVVPRMGKLVCQRYHFPNKAGPPDLSSEATPRPDVFEFVVDEKTLRKCYPGIKFVATVVGTNVGLYYIDQWYEVSGTFYTWCWNYGKRHKFKDWGPARPRNESDDGQDADAEEEESLEAEDEGEVMVGKPRDFPEIIVHNLEDRFTGENAHLNTSEVFKGTELSLEDSSWGAAAEQKQKREETAASNDQKRKDSAAEHGSSHGPVTSHPADSKLDPTSTCKDDDKAGDDGFFSDEDEAMEEDD